MSSVGEHIVAEFPPRRAWTSFRCPRCGCLLGLQYGGPERHVCCGLEFRLLPPEILIVSDGLVDAPCPHRPGVSLNRQGKAA